MRIMLLNIFFAVLGLYSCKKDPPPNPSDSTANKLELVEVWKTYLDEETKGEAYSINPILNSNGDVIMSNFPLSSTDYEPIKLYDGKTGELKWTWHDYDKPAQGFWGDNHTVVDNILFLSAHNITYALNMESGQTLWKNRVNKYGNPSIYSNNGYIYKGFTGESWEYAHYLYRTKYNEANWELVYKYTDTTKTYNSLFETTINFAKKSNGDELVIYPLEEGGSIKSTSILCCYNITQNKVEWITQYIDKFNSFRKGPQSVINNGMFFSFALNDYLVAFNIEDGSIAWDITLADPGIELFLYKNNLIVTTGNREPIYSINSSTGDINWQTLPNVGMLMGNSIVFKNYLISTVCDKLFIMNIDNGKVIAQKQIDKGCLQDGIAINEQEGVFYVQDRKYIRCFKLPEEVLK